jgi:predicted nucleotidyltransferase
MKKSQRLKLKKYFQTQPVELVYLFGSQAEGRTTPLSDYDFAVLFKENLSSSKRFERKLRYITDLGKILSTDKVEILDLNSAPPNFRFAAFAPRQEIYVKDEEKRVDFEFQTMEEFFDRLYYLRRHALVSLAKIAKEGL